MRIYNNQLTIQDDNFINGNEFLAISDKVIIVYKGPFYIHTSFHLADYLKSIIMQHYSKSIAHRLFGICIELSQNIAKYSAERSKSDRYNTGIGTLMVKQCNEYYKVMSSNLVHNSDIKKLTEYCEQLNTLDMYELKKLKAQTMIQIPRCDNSAHVGLIQISINSHNKIDYDFQSYDKECSWFRITTTILL